MATRIILIDKEYPEHWEYAKANGFWDLPRKSTLLRPGDRVYFWVTRRPGHVVGGATVASEPRLIREGTTHAWSPHDERRGHYTHRVALTDFEDLDATLTWGAVMAGAGGPGRLTPVTALPDGGTAWFEAKVGATQGSSSAAERLAREWATPGPAASASILEEDLRHRIEASIVVRRGQGQFRRKVLDAFGGRCCITGNGLESVLDAAHIVPYRGDQTDHPANGLLLRTDLHTLFDLHLLTVTPDLEVHVSPALSDSEYAQYDGQRMTEPSHGQGALLDFLRHHNRGCTWLSS